MNSPESQIQQLGFFISQFSEKAGRSFMEHAPQVLPLLSKEETTLWVQMGSRISQSSATAGIKFFRESPSRIKAIKPVFPLNEVFILGTKLAEKNYGVALEFFRQIPEVMHLISLEELAPWAQVGSDLGQDDYGTAIEYFKCSPLILSYLGVYQLAAWGSFGLALALEDTKTKDFLSIEFFRLSPEILRDIPSFFLRSKVLNMAALLTKTSGKMAMMFLRESPTFFFESVSHEIEEAVFDLGERLAESNPDVVVDYFKNYHQTLKIFGGSISKFEVWAKKGIEMARRTPEGAQAYFALTLKGAQETAKHLSQTLFLREVSRTLRLFAEGICGKRVEIRSGGDTGGHGGSSGEVITLPEKISAFPTIAENFRYYKVVVLHEAGHIEFGTYDKIPPDLFKTLGDLLIKQDGPAPQHLSSLFKRFPDPMLARNLWTIVEEGRIDYLLHHEYPGIRADLDFVISQQLKGRPDIFELNPKQAFLEALLRLSVMDTTDVPLALANEVSEAYTILKNLRRPSATHFDSIRAVVSLYPLLEKFVTEHSQKETKAQEEEEQSPPPPDTPNEGHEPMVNFSFRSPLDIRKIDRLQTLHERGEPGTQPKDSQQTSPTTSPSTSSATLDELLPSSDSAPPEPDHSFAYDEWDYRSGDFKPQWCHVFEKEIPSGNENFMDSIREEYGGAILSLRRYFECLRPEGFKKVKEQEHGEEIDIEAAIQSFIEKKAGISPSSRVYTRREKKTRDVSVALLMDMSGSTSQQLEGHPKRVIDVQKEGLLLFAEALDAIGDEYALFGFSGRSRNQVDCYLLKDFDQKYNHLTQSHIGGIQPMGQNRDGTAIRHITQKLQQRGSKIKILILISDGKPLDDDYSGMYALEDTKMALRQARASGIYPFCITVDQTAPEYIEKMYGEISYTIIQNVSTLPEKLPRIYKALTT